jgi:uncharacterized delta-60 repeat protein
LSDARLGVVRLLESGQPDPTFSGDGRLISNLLGGPGGNLAFTVTDVLIQPDNKILVTGHRRSNGAAALVRFNANGSVDTSFGGGDGIVTFAFNRANAVGLAPGGKIYVGGGHVVYPDEPDPDAPTTAQFAAARLHPNGSFDTAFSGDGQTITTFTGEASDVAVQGDSKVVLLGPTDLRAPRRFDDSGGGVVRLTASGGYDNSFSGDGRFFLSDHSSSGTIQSGELARDGDIVVGAKGIARTDIPLTPILTPIRLNGNGTVERFYDPVGVNVQAINVNDTRVAFDGQKVVFFLERAFDTFARAGVIVRYNRDGTADNTFGENGQVEISRAAFGDFQNDHKIVGTNNWEDEGGLGDVTVQVERRLYEPDTQPPPVTLSVRAAADNHVRDGSFAGTNFGSSTTMEVKRVNAPGYSREAYLRFDLTGVSSAEAITSAKVRLFGRMLNTAAPSVEVELYPVAEAKAHWTESGLTWNNRPQSAAVPLSTVIVAGTTARHYEFDVTNYLREQKAAGATAAAFAVKATTVGEGWAGFTSDEASANRPELRVARNTPPPPPPPPVSSATLNPLADAYVRDGTHAGNNFGQLPWLEVKRVNAPGFSRESYLRFEVTNTLPADSIDIAVLRLFGQKNDELTDAVDVAVYGVNPGDWTESGLTWNSRPAGGTLLTTQTIVNVPRSYTFDVTEYVRQQKAAGATIVEFAIRALTVSEGWVAFHSDESGQVGISGVHRPELVVGP